MGTPRLETPYRRVAHAVLAALAALAARTGCGEQRPEPNRRGCDDAIEPADQVPRAMRDQDKRGVGSGDVWFIVPQATRWSELLERRGSEARGKYPLWIDGSRLPEVTVKGIQGTEAPATPS